MRFRKRLFFVAVAFIVFHLTMMVPFVLPARWIPQFWTNGAIKYSHAFFPQYWAMFAPQPPMAQLNFEYEIGNGKWIAPADSLYPQYVANRLNPVAKRYQMIQHIAYFMLRDYDEWNANQHFNSPENFQAGSLSESYGYRAAVWFVKQREGTNLLKGTRVSIRVTVDPVLIPEITHPLEKDTLNFPEFEMD